MRHALFLSCLGLFACGGDDSSNTPDASGTDTGADQTVSDATKPDGNGNDSSTTTDGSTADAGFDVSIPDANFACNDPSTCDGGFCCANLVLGAGNPPNCPINSVSSACKGTCNTQLAFTCNTTEVVRFCAKNADCTEAQNPKCCEFQQGNQKVTFCASVAVSNFATKCL
jgi:hypothetical protein